MNATRDNWQAANRLLDQFSEISPTDIILLAFTPDSAFSAAVVSIAAEARGNRVSSIQMLPLLDNEIRMKIDNALPREIDSRLVVFTFESDTMSHTADFKSIFERFDRSKVLIIRCMCRPEELLSMSFSANPKILAMRNSYLLSVLTEAKTIHLRTPSGSDLMVTLDSQKYQWISNTGFPRAGSTIVLPPGEVATFPARIDGTLIADFAYNVNRVVHQDVRLSRHPVRIEIENGVAGSHFCDDKSTFDFVTDCFSQANGRRVGELGFGTNTAIAFAVPSNSHLNERHPGIHIGFGQHNQHGIVKYSCQVHLDLIASGGWITIPGTSINIDLRDDFFPTVEFPVAAIEEDVFSPGSRYLNSDCCGNDSTCHVS